MFVPRDWQKDCLERCKHRFEQGHTDFAIEATMGAGKSAMAAWLAKTMIDDYGVDHVLALVPWKSIQGDSEKGMLGEFSKTFGLDSRESFFTLRRRQAHQPMPQIDATVTLYQEVCNDEAIEALRYWKTKGFRFALICDEIHHTNEINGSWGRYVEQMVELAEYSIYMSGTYFRGDKQPISCIARDDNGNPIKHFAYTYQMGIRDGVVRPVTTRNINAQLTIYDKVHDQRYELPLSDIASKDLSAAKKQVLDPGGECMRHLIENVHEALSRTRLKYPDAACLFVCRPGTGDNYTTAGAESTEDKHVHIIAGQIKELTGIRPTVITHREKDAHGVLARFRRGTEPYLVAVNMVSEGCDIPRIRAIAFCRYTTSEMLFRQIVGRALRHTVNEDGTAAQVYIPTFPRLVEFANRLWAEAQEGVKDRRCHICGGWPCECPCPTCGQRPCECVHEPENEDPTIFALEAVPLLDGGHIGADDVHEDYVQAATTIAVQKLEQVHANVVQLGHALQYYDRHIRNLLANSRLGNNPVADRERLGRKINRLVRRIAYAKYDNKFDQAYHNVIEKKFGVSLKVMLNTWSVDRLRDVEDWVEKVLTEILRRG